MKAKQILEGARSAGYGEQSVEALRMFNNELAERGLGQGVRKRIGAHQLAIEDIPQVAELFVKVFGAPGHKVDQNLIEYIKDLSFGNPISSTSQGGVVYSDESGNITSAVLGIPVGYLIDGEQIRGRMLCAFMASGKGSTRAAASVSTSARPQDPAEFCFSDNASPRSAGHGRAGGAIVLPQNSLVWERPYRPVSAFVLRWQKRLPASLVSTFCFLSRPLDALIRCWFPSFGVAEAFRPKSTTKIETCSSDQFRATALALIKSVRLRPEWSKQEFEWLYLMASRNHTLGRLKTYLVSSENGTTIGAFMVYEKAQRTVRLLHLFAPDAELKRVYRAFFDLYDQKGFCTAIGVMEQRAFMAITEQTRLFFKANSYFCVSTQNEAVLDAIQKGDVVFGGLASEIWSQLTTDY